MSRVWAMPNSETFSVKPIGDFVKRYLAQATISIDPFARNKDWATYTNDLDPNTKAQCHLEAEDFAKYLQGLGIKGNLIIFDPPYSPRQLKECYDSIGRKMQLEDGQTARLRKVWRDALMPCLSDDAIALTFGWSTNGFGKKNGFEIIEIMLVAHGAEHNDTICMAERRVK